MPEHSGVSQFLAIISDSAKLANSIGEGLPVMLRHHMWTGSHLTRLTVEFVVISHTLQTYPWPVTD